MTEAGPWEGRLANVALVMLLVGVAVTGGALLWPGEEEYEIDPTLSATENERLQGEHDVMVFTLGAVTLAGMALVTFGGLVTSAIFCKSVVLKELGQSSGRQISGGRLDLNSLVGPEAMQMQEYSLGNSQRFHSYHSFEDPAQLPDLYQPDVQLDLAMFESSRTLQPADLSGDFNQRSQETVFGSHDHPQQPDGSYGCKSGFSPDNPDSALTEDCGAKSYGTITNAKNTR